MSAIITLVSYTLPLFMRQIIYGCSLQLLFQIQFRTNPLAYCVSRFLNEGPNLLTEQNNHEINPCLCIIDIYVLIPNFV